MKTIIRLSAVMAVMLLVFTFFAGTVCFAESEETASTTQSVEENENSGTSSKAMAAAACVAVVAAAGAISMGIAIARSVDGISRQPEAESKIRTALMLGLVFIETAIIYALIVAILIIFVM
ncbi:MAG: ATP synthase F0 subunit C [Clostridia bacterium]|nr:ATP synthase F0 subunit C [Clostridia bacterium]